MFGWGVGSFHFIRRPPFAVFVSDHFERAGLINHIVPAQTIFVLAFLLSAERFAVEKQFRFIAGSKNVDWRDLPDAFRPSPMGQNMRHRQIRTPARLIKIKTVFSESV